jgi:tetratricopeptide (TPR) repeat protein
MVRRWVNDLAHLAGWRINMIYQDLAADFAYHAFGDAKESDWARIEEWFSTRLEAARNRNAETWTNRGSSLLIMKRYDEAVAAYEQALMLDPTFIHAWNNKGTLFYNLKRYDEALAAYEQALDLDPTDVYTWTKQG